MPHEKTIRKIQKFFFETRYHSAYKAMHTEYGVDIAQQSRINFQRLFKEIKVQTFSPFEFQLWETWQTKIVPAFTLKHATSKVDFENLMPITMRQKEGEVVINANTVGSGVALKSFSYFVLGIGDHRTPSFLGNNVETIVVKLGKLSREQQRDFFGLWIGGHLHPYSLSETQDPIIFGETRRSISFDGEKLTKTYRYERANGEVIVRTVDFKDEIFSADQNLSTIFDALFYQFILELRVIGGNFQKYIDENATNPEIIRHAFDLLFPAWIYPEAKLPLKLVLHKPYIEITKQPEDFFGLTGRWFKAARENDVEELQQCLVQGVPIDTLNEDCCSALLVAADAYEPAQDAINFLLEQGADITLRNQLHQSLLQYLIENGERSVLERLLIGVPVPHLPLVKRSVNLGQYRIFSQTALEVAIQHEQFEMVMDLLRYGAVVTPTSPLVLKVYKYVSNAAKRKKWILFFLEQGAGVDVLDYDGKTSLMLAAEKGDIEFVTLLLDRGADPNKVFISQSENIDKHEGNTALHFAAASGHLEVAQLLVKRGAKLDMQNYSGDSPYFCVCKEREASLKEFFVSQNANTIPPVKTLAQQCKRRIFACAAFITCEVDGEPHVILVRKKNFKTKQSQGYFLAPGGFKDKKDISLEAAIRREIFEETNLRISDQDIVVQNGFPYVDITDTSEGKAYFELNFFHIALKQAPDLMQLTAKSDVAEVRLVKWSDVTHHDGCYFYNGIRVAQSNAMFIERLLLKKIFDGAGLDAVFGIERNGHALLPDMISKEDLPAIRDLYNRGVDFDKTLALIVACKQKKYSVVRLLIELGADVNIENSSFSMMETPLIVAVELGDLELVKFLVETCGAMIDIAGIGKSALVCAAQLNHQALVEYLLVQGASLGQGIGGAAVLATVAFSKNIAIARLLLKTQAINLNQEYMVNTYGRGLGGFSHFPLWAAVRAGEIEFVKLFLAHGADFWIHKDEIRLLDYIKQGLDSLLRAQKNGMHVEFLPYPSYDTLKTIAELFVRQLEQNQLDPVLLEKLKVGFHLEAAPQDDLAAFGIYLR